MEKKYKPKCFCYKWRVENFDFCWQKTGERIESPLFYIESSTKSSWRLWLYPRGEEDGEYISCYLFKEGGPEVMEVDFELSVSVGEVLVNPPVTFEKIYSFENHQKEGEKSFALRRDIYLKKPNWEKRFTVTIGCKMFIINGEMLKTTESFGRTTIDVQHISGKVVYYDGTVPTPEKITEIELATPIENNTLLNIRLIYANKSFVIAIIPKSCEMIKYAVCKITIVKNWETTSPIEHVRTWFGAFQGDVWKYDLSIPENDPDEDDATKTIFVQYGLSYSLELQHVSELHDFGTSLWIENLSLLESSLEHVKPDLSSGFPTVMDALKPAYEAKVFSDVTIKTDGAEFRAHKEVLRTRSSVLADMLKDNPETIKLPQATDITRRFLKFLYTDSVDDMYMCKTAIELYHMADDFEVELLKRKCSRFLEMNCDVKNVSACLDLATTFDDRALEEKLMRYIDLHAEEVFSTDEWHEFAENHWSRAEECMLRNYKRYS